MHWIAGFFDTLILLGALQGFIVSALLYYNSRPSSTDQSGGSGALSRRLLAALIFLLALACLDIFLMKQSWSTSTTAGAVLSAIIPLIIIMPVGPLIFFYIRSCLDPEFRISHRQRIHFYPVIIDLFPYALAILYILGILSGIIPNNVYHMGDFIDTYDVYSDIPRWLSLVIYLWLSGRYISAAAREGRQDKLQWPKNFVRIFSIFAIIWLLFLLPYVIPRYSNALIDTLDWYPIYLPLVFMIYWLGVKGYFISYQHTVEKKITRPPLQEDTVDQTILVLKRCMEEDRLWLDPGLNLSLLAKHSNIPPKTLSAVLNQHMNKTFNEFVNEYRVSEVRKRLLMPESRALTIAGLAYECGFNSLPTFQRAFKAILGLSPKEYLSQHGGSMRNE
ncbi:MAG: AraC family transcriptional regulator [Chitinophagaceae bacterium]|nr:AraC family transcriptional regulator [Chitinophagaceae bacterium]